MDFVRNIKIIPSGNKRLNEEPICDKYKFPFSALVANIDADLRAANPVGDLLPVRKSTRKSKPTRVILESPLRKLLHESASTDSCKLLSRKLCSEFLDQESVANSLSKFANESPERKKIRLFPQLPSNGSTSKLISELLPRVSTDEFSQESKSSTLTRKLNKISAESFDDCDNIQRQVSSRYRLTAPELPSLWNELSMNDLQSEFRDDDSPPELLPEVIITRGRISRRNSHNKEPVYSSLIPKPRKLKHTMHVSSKARENVLLLKGMKKRRNQWQCGFHTKLYQNPNPLLRSAQSTTSVKRQYRPRQKIQIPRTGIHRTRLSLDFDTKLRDGSTTTEKTKKQLLQMAKLITKQPEEYNNDGNQVTSNRTTKQSIFSVLPELRMEESGIEDNFLENNSKSIKQEFNSSALSPVTVTQESKWCTHSSVKTPTSDDKDEMQTVLVTPSKTNNIKEIKGWKNKLFILNEEVPNKNILGVEDSVNKNELSIVATAKLAQKEESTSIGDESILKKCISNEYKLANEHHWLKQDKPIQPDNISAFVSDTHDEYLTSHFKLNVTFEIPKNSTADSTSHICEDDDDSDLSVIRKQTSKLANISQLVIRKSLRGRKPKLAEPAPTKRKSITVSKQKSPVDIRVLLEKERHAEQDKMLSKGLNSCRCSLNKDRSFTCFCSALDEFLDLNHSLKSDYSALPPVTVTPVIVRPVTVTQVIVPPVTETLVIVPPVTETLVIVPPVTETLVIVPPVTITPVALTSSTYYDDKQCSIAYSTSAECAVTGVVPIEQLKQSPKPKAVSLPVPQIPFRNPEPVIIRNKVPCTPFRKSKMERELLRLGANVVHCRTVKSEVGPSCPKKDCDYPHCRLGCICDSLNAPPYIQDHCGKVNCMFQCECKTPEVRSPEVRRHILSDEAIARIAQAQIRDFAKEEQKFKMTVISQDSVTVVQSRGKREQKLPAWLRDSSSIMLGKEIEAMESLQVKNHAIGLPAASRKRKKINFTRRPKILSCVVMVRKLPGKLIGARSYCTHHKSCCCQCISSQYNVALKRTSVSSLKYSKHQQRNRLRYSARTIPYIVHQKQNCNAITESTSHKSHSTSEVQSLSPEISANRSSKNILEVESDYVVDVESVSEEYALNQNCSSALETESSSKEGSGSHHTEANCFDQDEFENQNSKNFLELQSLSPEHATSQTKYISEKESLGQNDPSSLNHKNVSETETHGQDDTSGQNHNNGSEAESRCQEHPSSQNFVNIPAVMTVSVNVEGESTTPLHPLITDSDSHTPFEQERADDEAEFQIPKIVSVSSMGKETSIESVISNSGDSGNHNSDHLCYKGRPESNTDAVEISCKSTVVNPVENDFINYCNRKGHNSSNMQRLSDFLAGSFSVGRELNFRHSAQKQVMSWTIFKQKVKFGQYTVWFVPHVGIHLIVTNKDKPPAKFSVKIQDVDEAKRPELVKELLNGSYISKPGIKDTQDSKLIALFIIYKGMWELLGRVQTGKKSIITPQHPSISHKRIRNSSKKPQMNKRKTCVKLDKKKIVTPPELCTSHTITVNTTQEPCKIYSNELPLLPLNPEMLSVQSAIALDMAQKTSINSPKKLKMLKKRVQVQKKNIVKHQQQVVLETTNTPSNNLAKELQNLNVNSEDISTEMKGKNVITTEQVFTPKTSAVDTTDTPLKMEMKEVVTPEKISTVQDILVYTAQKPRNVSSIELPHVTLIPENASVELEEKNVTHQQVSTNCTTSLDTACISSKNSTKELSIVTLIPGIVAKEKENGLCQQDPVSNAIKLDTTYKACNDFSKPILENTSMETKSKNAITSQQLSIALATSMDTTCNPNKDLLKPLPCLSLISETVNLQREKKKVTTMLDDDIALGTTHKLSKHSSDELPHVIIIPENTSVKTRIVNKNIRIPHQVSTVHAITVNPACKPINNSSKELYCSTIIPKNTSVDMDKMNIIISENVSTTSVIKQETICNPSSCSSNDVGLPQVTLTSESVSLQMEKKTVITLEQNSTRGTLSSDTKYKPSNNSTKELVTPENKKMEAMKVTSQMVSDPSTISVYTTHVPNRTYSNLIPCLALISETETQQMEKISTASVITLDTTHNPNKNSSSELADNTSHSDINTAIDSKSDEPHQISVESGTSLPAKIENTSPADPVFSYNVNVNVPFVSMSCILSNASESQTTPQIYLPITPSDMVWSLINVELKRSQLLSIPQLGLLVQGIQVEEILRIANEPNNQKTVAMFFGNCPIYIMSSKKVPDFDMLFGIYAFPGIHTHVICGPYYARAVTGNILLGNLNKFCITLLDHKDKVSPKNFNFNPFKFSKSVKNSKRAIGYEFLKKRKHGSISVKSSQVPAVNILQPVVPVLEQKTSAKLPTAVVETKCETFTTPGEMELYEQVVFEEVEIQTSEDTETQAMGGEHSQEFSDNPEKVPKNIQKIKYDSKQKHVLIRQLRKKLATSSHIESTPSTILKSYLTSAKPSNTSDKKENVMQILKQKQDHKLPAETFDQTNMVCRDTVDTETGANSVNHDRETSTKPCTSNDTSNDSVVNSETVKIKDIENLKTASNFPLNYKTIPDGKIKKCYIIAIKGSPAQVAQNEILYRNKVSFVNEHTKDMQKLLKVMDLKKPAQTLQISEVSCSSAASSCVGVPSDGKASINIMNRTKDTDIKVTEESTIICVQPFQMEKSCSSAGPSVVSADANPSLQALTTKNIGIKETTGLAPNKVDAGKRRGVKHKHSDDHNQLFFNLASVVGVHIKGQDYKKAILDESCVAIRELEEKECNLKSEVESLSTQKDLLFRKYNDLLEDFPQSVRDQYNAELCTSNDNLENIQAADSLSETDVDLYSDDTSDIAISETTDFAQDTASQSSSDTKSNTNSSKEKDM